jgi:hypothetical protein
MATSAVVIVQGHAVEVLDVYVGADGVRRDPVEQVAHLRRCALAWRQLATSVTRELVENVKWASILDERANVLEVAARLLKK